MRGLSALLLALMLLLPGAARAQAPISIIVNFAAGGPTDVTARILAPELGSRLGAPVVVRNVIGASGTIGTAEAARAKPDGQTLLFSPVGPIAIQPNFMRGIAYQPADLTPVCQVTDTPIFMMTPKTSGLRTAADVVARAKEQGGSMPYGSSGIGTIPHMSMVAWTRAAGAPMLHVPFRGSAEVMLAFQQGNIAIMSDQPALIVRFDLHPVAIFAEARAAEFPGTPTMREMGWDLQFSIWQGLFAPAGLPPGTLARIEAACAEAMRTPSVIEAIRKLQMPMVWRDARAMAAFVTAESAKYRALIEAVGMRQAE